MKIKVEDAESREVEVLTLRGVEQTDAGTGAPGGQPSTHLEVTASGSSEPSLRWRNILSFTFEDTPADGTIISTGTTLPVGTWLQDVYLNVLTDWDPILQNPRLAACGWDLAGNFGGQFFLHQQMNFNLGSWADLGVVGDNQFISGNNQSTVPNSLLGAGYFLGSNISADPVETSPPIRNQSRLPGLIRDASLPLEIMFANDGGAETYLFGAADLWILAQDPA